MKQIQLTLLIGLVASFISCNKTQIDEHDIHNVEAKSNALLFQTLGNPIPPLDWENIDFMPTPDNTLIPVPWQSGISGAKMDDDIIFDYKSEDGWDLVYNTFSETQQFNNQYFMLYNRYNGLLRVYFYFAADSEYQSSNIAHFLNLRGSAAGNSPLLAFAAGDLIDINNENNITSVSQLQPYKVSSTGS